MPNYAAILRNLTHTAQDWKVVREAAMAGKVGKVSDITDGVRAAVEVERGLEAGRPLEEILRPMAPRQQAMAEFVLSTNKDPERFRDLPLRMKSAIEAGQEPDPGRIALDLLDALPPEQRALGLNLAEVRTKYTDDWFNASDGVGDPSIYDVLAANQPPPEALREIPIGSEPDGRLAPGDILSAVETQRVATEAAESPLRMTAETRASDLYGPTGPFAEQFQEQVLGLQDILATGRTERAMRGIEPTFLDHALHAAPGSLARDEIAKERAIPEATFHAGMVEKLADGDEAAQAYVQADLAHSEAVNTKGVSGLDRPKDARKAVPNPPDDPLAPTKRPPEMPPPPGHGGGRPWLWNLVRGSGSLFRWVEYYLPKEMWQPVRIASGKAYDLAHGFYDYIEPTIIGVKRGSEEASHIGRLIDLGPYGGDRHFQIVESEIARYAAQVANGRPEAQQRVDALTKTLEWMRQEKAKMDAFDASLSPQKREQLHTAARAIRKSLDAAGWLLMQAGGNWKMDRTVSKFGDLRGLPIGGYFPHVFPDWEEALKLGKVPWTKETPPEVQVFNKHLLPRVGYGKYSFDIHDAIAPYFDLLGRKLYVEPALKAIIPPNFPVLDEASAPWVKRLLTPEYYKSAAYENAKRVTKNLDDTQVHYAGEWIKSMLGVPTNQDDWVRNMVRMAGKRAPEGSYAQKWMFNVAQRSRPALEAGLLLLNRVNQGALGLNLGFAIKNMTQPIIAIAETDLLTWAVGSRTFYSKEGFNLTTDLSLSREFQRILEKNPSLYAPMHGGDAHEAMRRLETVVMFAGEATEFTNRGLVLHMGIADAMARRGFKTVGEATRAGQWDEILREGVELSEATNFVYGSLNMNPYIARNPFFRLGTQFTSYPYMMLETWNRWARSNPTAMGQYLGITGWMSSLAWRGGTDVTNWLGLPGAAQFATGKDFPVRSVFTDAMANGWRVLNGREDPAVREQAWDSFLGSAVIAMLPAYVGAKRLLDTSDLLLTDRVRDQRRKPIREFKGRFADYAEASLGFRSRATTTQRKATVEKRDAEYRRGKITRDAAEDIMDLRLRQGGAPLGRSWAGDIANKIKFIVSGKPSPEEVREIEEEVQQILRDVRENGGNRQKVLEDVRDALNEEKKRDGQFDWQMALRTSPYPEVREIWQRLYAESR